MYRGDDSPSGKGYVFAATLTVLTYDYLCTLEREVAHIWTRPWSFGTCLFLLNRYLPFVDTVMALRLTRAVTTPEICRVQHIIFISILTGGILLSEVILMLRTYAIWNGNRLVLGILCGLGFALCAVLVALLRVGEGTFQFEPVLEYRYGCNIQVGSGLTTLLYVMILFSETAIVILTMIKAIQDRPHRSSWVSRLYKDGLLFYLYMLAITIANVVVSSLGKLPAEKNMLSG
ncbi:hypothetical protein BDZ94DRAFT_1305929 [Collybia nuda]|uniref:DUF6533 domain-containing protein n=1 Tax=Collybia nuda TaxID=64659 RepID=A0A9P6CN79_9AGAR|nr:hypothetical protein BDZ94DRAFT_1305929 [Collybia nuda]